MHWRIERILSYLFEEMGDRTFDVHKFPNVDPDRPNLGDILRTCYGKVIGAHSEELRCAVDNTFNGPDVRAYEAAAFGPPDHLRGVLSGLLISDDDTLFEAALSALVDAHSVHGKLVDAIERGTFPRGRASRAPRRGRASGGRGRRPRRRPTRPSR